MPSSPIISVKNIGKKYKLGATLGGRNYKTLRDVLTQAAFGSIRKLSAAFRKEHSTGDSHSSPNNPTTQSPNNLITQLPNNQITKSPNNSKEFWALKDISFDVQQGEVVGIIGRNGAGKSTLLKILSEITEPTEGEIRIRGRVASLLEVGTGFHPELSGRENIFMNGAILGMTRSEIKAKFDQIVAFAEVEKFVDTPVKRYSSGMYVRLAFAVAAHLEPEILIVDEVLAVGDMPFRKKCLGKMGDIASEGRTVLFVSHNMAAISNLCKKSMLLNHGRIQEIGNTENVITRYLSHCLEEARLPITARLNRRGNGKVRITGIGFYDVQSRLPLKQARSGQDIYIEVTYKAFEFTESKLRDFNIGLAIFNEIGQFVMVLNSQMANNSFTFLRPSGKVYCLIPRLPLMCGNYSITATLQVNNDLADQLEHAATIFVEPGDFFETGVDNSGNRQGVYVLHKWYKALDFDAISIHLLKRSY